MQAVQELNMRMAHAQEVQGFVANMQHAQVREVSGLGTVNNYRFVLFLC